MSLRDSLRRLFGANRRYLPSSTYFDHLYSEYQALDKTIISEPDRELLDQIHERRHAKDASETRFSWDEIYTFELILVKYLTLDGLRNKAIRLRTEYKNIFGDDKYKTYLETNPPKPTDQPGPPTPEDPDPAETLKNSFLRDVRYLLGELFTSFAALSSRDGLGKWMTEWAAYLVGAAFIVGVALLFFSYKGIPLVNQKIPGSPILVVFFAGAMGGLVSVLQRLQSIPSDGDPIYSLAAFWHGAYAMFVSPLTGAVFGIVLYLLFAGGVLQGTFFPRIFTPQAETACEVATTSTPTPTPSPTPTPTPVRAATTTPTPTPTPTPTQTPTTTNPTTATNPTAAPTPTPMPTPTPTPATGSTSFGRFLKCAGPVNGTDYALLIIWCFIAGFAERLVPDTLNRLVDENVKTAKKT